MTYAILTTVLSAGYSIEWRRVPLHDLLYDRNGVETPIFAWTIIAVLLFVAYRCFAYGCRSLAQTFSRSEDTDLPEEMAARGTADRYDDQATQLRALKRRLDAETDYKESQLKSALKGDELEEIEDILRHERAKRGASGRRR